MQCPRDAVFTPSVFAETRVLPGQAIAMPFLPAAVMAFAIYPYSKSRVMRRFE
jgi:hypothetical protein